MTDWIQEPCADMWNTQCPACGPHLRTKHQEQAQLLLGRCTCSQLCWSLFSAYLMFKKSSKLMRIYEKSYSVHIAGHFTISNLFNLYHLCFLIENLVLPVWKITCCSEINLKLMKFYLRTSDYDTYSNNLKHTCTTELKLYHLHIK